MSSFGTFSVQSKRQRVGRNPKTGIEAVITPRRVLSFRPSHILKDRVDNALMTDKSSDAFRTISEVSAALDVPRMYCVFGKPDLLVCAR